ncbi:TOBE domain-containing protein [Massilia sp. IC2-477]|uniref:TOBE domain-containing protein n=1 Tax=Massilia sp. IC2-477 TaxID=2887198 RepID=UPI001D1188E8|nr:TOBE domain-containing protein [Massilia sp. IC2-477]MCC2955907.1 TOBE domain-containing protein [Massilia sp. IC2-477]
MNKRTLPLDEVLGFQAGDKRIDILRRVGQAGSISEAARAAGVSYKAAWQALETLANLAGTALVEKAVGGSGGGGATLTRAGERVLEAADEMARARQHILARFALGDASGRAAFALRTSMRNQFPCAVGSIASRAGQVRVQLLLAGGSVLHSRITRESAQLLGLQRGMEVLALCKATAVQVAGHIDASTQENVLAGEIVRASRDASGGEATLRLPGGVQLVGFSGPHAALRAGSPAMAAIDEASVVIGMPH